MVLVTGGCGYVGSVLVPRLIVDGHDVSVIDIQWFGNALPELVGLDVRKADMRDGVDCAGYDAVIHLAAVANDPTGDLDAKLTWEVNALATMRLADAAAKAGVKQFIYASSGSVYGVSDAPSVTEDARLNPISDYNRTKMVAERCVLSYASSMAVQIVRPATVCGLSQRMRLDVAVNMLTMQALTKGEITVLGGNQYRPNIHIDDMADLYLFMLANPALTGIYNAGFENRSIMDIAKKIAKRTKAIINVHESNDPRSYRMDSAKLLGTGFSPKRTVKMAIAQMIEAFNAGKLEDNDQWHNLRTMRLFV